ncbi:major facilitator superfamily domain-containing protein [Biscogniauxia mediterranea]|nr:major facilitator superfamily domain-containing protein [Biscogniauxia mediterranea]
MALTTEENTAPSETAPLLGPAAGSGAHVSPDGSIASSSDEEVGNNTSGRSGAGDAENGEPPVIKDVDEDGPKLQVNRAALLPALAIGIFLIALDQTLVIATYGKIGSDLRALQSTSWIGTSYYLTLTTFQPLYGRLSAIFGRRACLLFAYAVFGLSCLGCALARDIAQLCAARAVAGVGGGGMNAIVTILVTDLVSLRDRGLWQGYINTVYTVGMAAGAPVGGLLADSIGWRWSFAGQVPIAAAAWLSVFIVLRLPRGAESDHWIEKVRRIDFAGALTLTSAVFLLLLGLDNGSNLGWARRATITPLALTPLFFGIFILIEGQFAAHPFAPGHIIFFPPLLASYLANFFGVAFQVGVLFFLALYLQAALGLSATGAGIALLPNTIFGLCGSLGCGLIIRRTGRYYWLTIGGFVLQLLSIVIIVAFAGGFMNSLVGVVAGLCLLMLGSGATITALLIAIIASVPRGGASSDVPVAIACSYLFRSLGSTLGISVTTAALQQALRLGLEKELDGDKERARAIEEAVRRSLDYVRELEPHLADVVRRCYAAATRAAFVPAGVLAASALVAAVWIKEKKLGR